jgi:hypothetical protein
MTLAVIVGCGQDSAEAEDSGFPSPRDGGSDDAAGGGDSIGCDDARYLCDGGGTPEPPHCLSGQAWPPYAANPFRIPTSVPPLTMRGGIIVADFDGDCLLDYAISQRDGEYDETHHPVILAVYTHHGAELWRSEVDMRLLEDIGVDGMAGGGLPGEFGPGIGAADVDGDGNVDLVHLSRSNEIVIRDGRTGVVKRTHSLPPPAGGDAWGMLQVVNLRGAGDRDAIVQADRVPFRWIAGVNLETGQILWTHDGYHGPKHGGFRAADLDGDGRDEVLGATLIGPDGQRLNEWTHPLPMPSDANHYQAHFDAVHVGDARPDLPGLEVLLLEEWGGDTQDHTALVNVQEIIWRSHRDYADPHAAAIGKFDRNRPGLQTWIRSRYNDDQRPYLFDGLGNIVASYVMNEVKPADWTVRGVESISTIDWDGDGRQLIAVKERHTLEGQIAIKDAVTGQFLRVWDERAARILVADVAGDNREEIIVFNNVEREIRIYHNIAEGTGSSERLWRHNWYRRMKQNYDYYSTSP